MEADPSQISLWASKKIFLGADQMQALKLPTGQNLSLFFCLRVDFMLSLCIGRVDSGKVSSQKVSQQSCKCIW